MKGIRYTAEFKAEAIKQITERGHNTADVAERLGISTKSINKWIEEAELQKQPIVNKDVAALKQEVIRLNAALKRTIKERDILKKPPCTLPVTKSDVHLYRPTLRSV
jgi:transposase